MRPAHSSATFERLYRDKGRNEEHLKKLRRQEVEEEMRECSFKPNIKSKFSDSVVTNGKLEDRLHDWVCPCKWEIDRERERDSSCCIRLTHLKLLTTQLHRRDAKRAQQQQEKANWVDDQCTFQPNITRKGAMAKAKVDSPRQRARSPPATEADRVRIQAKARAAREWAARAEQLATGAGEGTIMSSGRPIETGMTPMTTVEKARARIDAVLSDLQPKKEVKDQEDITGIDTEKWRALLRESIIQSEPSAAANTAASASEEQKFISGSELEEQRRQTILKEQAMALEFVSGDGGDVDLSVMHRSAASASAAAMAAAAAAAEASREAGEPVEGALASKISAAREKKRKMGKSRKQSLAK